ncbi:MAG: DUF86 domain-containing protein [Nitrospinae bacterium]|nr:DUF86 domain-containing protein [Nitrospinota bacterium]
MRDPRERLMDILEAVAAIEKYAARGREVFARDELVQTWIVHNLQIIGEAAANLGIAFHDSHPSVPWAPIVAMRNILVHEYFGIDANEVWRAVEKDLPVLKKAIGEILQEIN